jgi:hypothetical protein
MPGIGIGIGLGFGSKVSWSAYWTQQYQDVLDSFLTTPDNSTKLYQARMVRKLVDGGYWDGFDLFYLFASHADGDQYHNWKTPGIFDATAQGAVAFEQFKGVNGNSSGYLTTGYNTKTSSTQFTAASASLYVVSQTANAQAGCEVGNRDAAGARNELLCYYSDNNTYALITEPSNNTLTISSDATYGGKGHHFLNKITDIKQRLYRKRSYNFGNGAATPTLPDIELYFLARNNQGVADRKSTKQLSLGVVGRGFYWYEIMAIQDIIEEYLDAVGAETYQDQTAFKIYPSTKLEINLETYVANNDETIHPSVIDIGSAWNGYRYWMANTPYPSLLYGGSANNYENPSIWCSNDGNTWIVPPGLTNPVIPKPVTFNADTELYYENNTLYLLWNQWNALNYHETYISSSADGITWSPKQLIFSPGDGLGDSGIASVSLVKISGTYYLYYVNVNVSTYISIKRRSCATIDGNYINPETITFPVTIPTLNTYWHLGVKLYSSKIYMAISTGWYTGNWNYCNIGESVDGLIFTINPEPEMSPAISDEDNGIVYRPSLTTLGNELYMYYSRYNSVRGWGTHRVKIDLL